MRQPREQVRTLHLDHDQLLILDGRRDGRVRVLHGGVWLTEAGSPDDTFLRSGQEAAVQGRQAVLQAEPGTALELRWRPPARRAGAWRRLRAWAARWQLGPLPDACG